MITGASDDDPSGIATYSQAGAQAGYGMLWTMVLLYPFMAATQEISALIGRVTGRGIAGNMRQFYSGWIMYPVVSLLLIANTINLAADISAMGTALKLIIDGPALLYSTGLAIMSLTLQILIPYNRYSGILKWLTVVLFSYAATLFVVHVDWAAAARGAFIPSLSFDSKTILVLVGVLGTTISPYPFFWQSSAEVEEVEANAKEKPLKKAPQHCRGGRSFPYPWEVTRPRSWQFLLRIVLFCFFASHKLSERESRSRPRINPVWLPTTATVRSIRKNNTALKTTITTSTRVTTIHTRAIATAVRAILMRQRISALLSPSERR